MASLLDLAQARLQGLLDIPTRAARALVNPTAFSGLLGAPTLPQQQGMTEAAYGLPARQNMSVLDPNQAAYLQGYQQGEPLAYLGMATPFAAPAAVAGAKAVAPKAGMALENYMAQQGLIQPLTAFHGTPHTIRGKFDINKVGTGEGAQAYGHGMYFAENPEVAKTYANIGTGNIAYRGHTEDVLNKLQKSGIDRETADLVSTFAYEGGYKGGTSKDLSNFLKSYADTPEEIKLYKDLSSKPEVVEAINSYVSPKQANLYKVDIPDADIPMMLDYDKPLSQQPKGVQKALAKYDPDMYSPKGSDYDSAELGQSIYQRIIQDNVQKFGHGGNQKRASEALNALGIKGIRYYDEGSRKAGGTSNFVVFDPTDVKILEKNSQKVEGLLD